ncbi:MAG: bacterial Ig-like domain-containing protein [Anaeroplasma bactoclasticum]|nr:bacterial Ig-like domain-containing protein [Anaeroplasma bactoclasticum]
MKKRGIIYLVLSLFAIAVITGCKNNEDQKEPPVEQTDELQKIEVSGGTRKFTVGTDFSVGDLVVKATYSQSGEKTITGYQVDSSKVDKAKAGSYEIVVTFEGKTAKYQVTYEEAPVVITHRDAFVSELPEGSVTRKFNEAFDTTINDFSSATLAGTTSNGVYDTTPTLRVLVDNEAEGFPKSPDASIYKMASGTYELASASNIGFKMRVVSGTLDYSNLVLGLRGDDAFNVFEINLVDALDDDGEALPTLTNEFQDVMISPNLSIEDADTKYVVTASGEASEVKVLDKIIGFHLYAKGECSAVIEIKEVFMNVASEKTVLDKFDRDAVNKTDTTCWWRDSTGFIVLPNITLNGGASYTTPTVAVASNTQLVASILGDTTGLTIAAVVNGAAQTAVAWANLKNKDDAVVTNAVEGAFYPYAIDLEKSGLLVEGLEGFVFTSSTECSIANLFYSELKEKEALKDYPRIDSKNVVIFDNFNRTQTTIDTSYEASIINEKVLDAGLYYMISYNGADKVSIDGDALVFAPQADYTNLDFASSRERTNQKYLVIVAKGDLSGFRFNGGSGDVAWSHDWYAGEGLKSIPADLTDYPYVTEDGYVWYIIDLELTRLTVEDHLTMYFTGEATLSIDSIFFANESKLVKWVDLRSDEEIVDTTEGYKYLWGGTNTNGTRFCMELKGDGTVTFESFRIGYVSKTVWLKDGLKAYYEDGTLVAATDVIPTTATKVYIDFEENGFDVAAEDIHLHWGDFGEAKGAITLLNTSVMVPSQYSETFVDEPTDVVVSTEYGYLYGGYNGNGLSTLKFTVSGDGAVALHTFRLQIQDDKTIYANNGLVILKEDGTTYDYTQAISDEMVLYIDLAASSFEVLNNHIHLHFGQEELGLGTLTIKSIEAVSDVLPYSVSLNAYDEAIPTPVE